MDEVTAKLLNVPLVTVMSPTAKSVVASLEVNVRDSVASLDVSPSLTSDAVITIAGAGPTRRLAVLFDCDVAAAFAAAS